VGVNLRSLISKVNDTTRTTMEAAAGMCLARSQYDVEVEHFLLKLLDAQESDLRFIAAHFLLDLGRMAAELSRSLDRLKTGNARTPAFSPYLVEALVRAWVYASIDYNATRIRSGFVVIALLAEEELLKLMRGISPEICKIDIAALRRDFTAIVGQSVEASEVPAVPEVAPGSQTPPGGPRVFISYRRDDGDFYADSLFDRILAVVPNARVFRDTDTLKPGMLFSEKIDETVRSCDILLALIGKKWLKASDGTGARRLDKPDDWVRLEIATALRHGKTVVPCLVGGAKMPSGADLPPDLAGLELRQAVHISQLKFRRDVEELMELLGTWAPPMRKSGT
jgi:hypothetical protein